VSYQHFSAQKQASSMQQPARDYDVLMNILIVGNLGVGKTCLVTRYTKGVYEPDEPSTVNTYLGPIIKNKEYGKKVRLQVHDTGGPEQLGFMTSSNYSGVQGVLIAFDMTDKSSFKDVTMWLRELERYTRQVPKVIVATKSDLVAKRAVQTAEGEDVAEENDCSYFECSAKENTNVEPIFVKLSQVIADKILGEKKKVLAGEDGEVVPSASALLVMEKKGRCVMS